jgi:hypothetical protein
MSQRSDFRSRPGNQVAIMLYRGLDHYQNRARVACNDRLRADSCHRHSQRSKIRPVMTGINVGAIATRHEVSADRAIHRTRANGVAQRARLIRWGIAMTKQRVAYASRVARRLAYLAVKWSNAKKENCL